jgi:dTDP-4-dehydrorhamnose reductase
MILLLGASGYTGQAFANWLEKAGLPYAAPTHREVDAADAGAMRALVRAVRPNYAINAIGFTGRPNIDNTEQEKLRCLRVNTEIPGILAEVFADEGIRWGHVSSGCIYDGTKPDGSPFTEDDPPNFAFSHPRSSWYAKTKALAESLLADAPNCLIWRMRIPFDEFDHERNYLSKILRYEKLLEVCGSISQRQEFVKAALETLRRELPGGLYNITNPGAIWTSEIVEAIRRRGISKKAFRYFENIEEFLAAPGRVYRASCVLSSKKLLDAGIPLREIHEAVEDTLSRWIPA